MEEQILSEGAGVTVLHTETAVLLGVAGQRGKVLRLDARGVVVEVKTREGRRIARLQPEDVTTTKVPRAILTK